MRRVAHWGVPFVLAAASLAVQAGGEAARVALRFDRQPIADGQFWRLLSGHVAHLGLGHTILNVAALCLIWLLVGGAISTAEWTVIVLVTIGGIDLGLWFFDPGLDWYVGLSGLLHGLFAAGLVARVRVAPTETLVLGGLLAAKIAFEQFAGPLPWSEESTGGAVVVDAHLYGAVSGAIVASVGRIGVRRRLPI